MQSSFETNIKANPRIGRILFILVWLGAVFFIFSKKGFNNWIEYIFLVASVYLFLSLIWLISGSIKVVLTDEKLVLEEQLTNFTYWRNTYDLDKIDNLQKKTNDEADTYTRFGVSKIYDINPSVIYFNYNGSSQKIGEGLENFNAELIIKEIETRKLNLSKSKHVSL